LRPQKVDTETLLMGALSVLKEKGFDGASLNELAKATGLQKASLYHRFPGGKEEIAQNVFCFIEEWILNKLVKILNDPAVSPEKRLSRVLKNIDSLYQGGKDVCFIRSLSMGTGKQLFSDDIQKVLHIWIKAFYEFGLGIGFNNEKAQETAEHSLMIIQGSLVLSNAMDEPKHFKNALIQVKENYFS